MLAIWGTTLLRGLVPEDGISWQGHLFGALGGILAARAAAPPRGPRRHGVPGRPHAVLMVPLGAAATLEELETDPHPLLARLRAEEPVAWVPALGGWLVTRRDLALQVMRDPDTFTVDDERFSTGRVVGPSMLSLDGEAHRRHRAPFARPFRLDAVRERFRAPVTDEVGRLLDAIAPAGEAELRRELAGPLAAAAVTLRARARGGRDRRGPRLVRRDRRLRHRDQRRARADRGRRARLRGAARRAGAGARARAGVVAAGGRRGRRRRPRPRRGDVERRRDAVRRHRDDRGHDRQRDRAPARSIPAQLAAVRAEPALLANAIEESLRLEPAAAVIDRYSTRATTLGGAEIGERELVIVSIAGANRDPAVFPDPDRFDVRRENAKLHAAFAHGPHVCIGMHLARLEAHEAVGRDARAAAGAAARRATPPARGLVFRKPDALRVRWTPAAVG